jgi:hypothetical protein
MSTAPVNSQARRTRSTTPAGESRAGRPTDGTESDTSPRGRVSSGMGVPSRPIAVAHGEWGGPSHCAASAGARLHSRSRRRRTDAGRAGAGILALPVGRSACGSTTGDRRRARRAGGLIRHRPRHGPGDHRHRLLPAPGVRADDIAASYRGRHPRGPGTDAGSGCSRCNAHRAPSPRTPRARFTTGWPETTPPVRDRRRRRSCPSRSYGRR